MRIVIAGLSITSSWGNGHATTYRGLVRELAARGHEVLFLERDLPGDARHRDAPAPEGCTVARYRALGDLEAHRDAVRGADAVILGSLVPEGARVGEWLLDRARGATAFYDLDTPVTLARLTSGDADDLSVELVPRFDLYLSFTGGRTLRRLESAFGARRAEALYCSADPRRYRPVPVPERWALGFLGTYGQDRQPTLERLLLEPAWRRARDAFVVAGPRYPEGIGWPPNVDRVEHVAPADHPAFYSAQRLTLNVTRAEMIVAGYAPSVRLFEAAACGVPVVSDAWEGLETFFEPGREILVARTSEDVEAHLDGVDPGRRAALGEGARRRVLAAHTAAHRARQLEGYLESVRGRRRARGRGMREATSRSASGR